MSSTFGKKVSVTLFGESHGTAIGSIVEGFPAGLKIDWSQIEKEMDRRKPGQTAFSTPRAESDLPEVVSGLYNGYTTGAPITCLIKNTNTRSSDYEAHRTIMRPSHADYTAQLKYNGYADPRGGGHFSGRLTAGLVFAGALAKQKLQAHGIHIVGRICQIGPHRDKDMGILEWCEVVENRQHTLFKDFYFPMFDDIAEIQAKAAIETARVNGDSIGGMVEVVAFNVPGGMGNPIFDGIENRLSAAIFGIPGVKGLLFGAGMSFASGLGSELNDAMFVRNNEVISQTNHNGGINGGITNGMPLQLSVILKPTPSIGKSQKTVEKTVGNDGEVNWIETENVIHGRHDPCIVPRALPVVEAVLALVLLDFMMEGKG